MRVAPTQLIDLARECESSAEELKDLWTQGVGVLAAACSRLGDSPAAPTVSTAYDTAVSSAHSVVNGLGLALDSAVDALLETAGDVVGADEETAGRMDRVRGHGTDHGDGRGRDGHGGGNGGGRGHGGGR